MIRAPTSYCVLWSLQRPSGNRLRPFCRTGRKTHDIAAGIGAAHPKDGTVQRMLARFYLAERCCDFAALRAYGRVMDDEAPVRDILRRVLTDLNFRVLMAADGTSALQEISTRGDDISIVITDLHMPHLGGLSFVRVLRSRLPDVGVIVASGLVDERERDQLHNLGVRGLINKPFTIEELVEALQEVCAH